MKQSNKCFRFADATFKSLGSVEILLSTSPGVRSIFVSIDVVSADVPALLGLEALDSHRLTDDTVSKRLVKKKLACNGEGK